jgi:drug/metabolite transporter (DMT)-like permease
LLSVIYGLISAIGWGAADFTGGLASRRSNPYQVLLLAEVAGIFPLLLAALLTREPVPGLATWLWAAAASALGTFGLLLLYRGLAEGSMTIAAPVSALLAAVVPVVVAFITEGLPSQLTIFGFVLALSSIWIISQNGDNRDIRLNLRTLQLPLLSGLFFGFYFVLIHQATRQGLFWPLVAARMAGTLIMAAYALVKRGPFLPARGVRPLVILGGVLDVSGNLFYVLASHAGRMDVAAVLGSLYPASTALLAALVLKEKISPLQFVGIFLALVAIAILAA